MSTSFTDKVLSEIGDIVKKIIIAAVIIITLLMAAYWWLLFAITPQADLPRDAEGTFIVTPDNYRHWHTYSRMHHSKNASAHLEGKFIMRSIGTVSSTCHNIPNCDKYESQFKQYNDSKRKVYVLEKQYDDDFSQYISHIKQSVIEHNNSITDFDVKAKFKQPNRPNFVLSQLTYHTEASNQQQNIQNKLFRYAKRRCRNNGRGCDVHLRVNYSTFLFPTHSIEAYQ